jgi:tetratricopeptide (TPR) repeat protein
MTPILLLLVHLGNASGMQMHQTQSISAPDPVLTTVDSMRAEGAYEQAFKRLQELENVTTKNPEILWRMAHLRIEIAEEYSSARDREEAFRQALKDADRAVERGPRNSNAYTARAMAAGKVSLITSSTEEKIRLSRVMKESVDQALTYNPRNDIAYYIRGRWHTELASLSFMERTVARALYGGLPSASLKQAEADLQRAIQLEDRIVYRLELARVYAEQNDEKGAEKQLKKLLEMPNTYPDDPRYKKEARELMNNSLSAIAPGTPLSVDPTQVSTG